jgi:hypothetical protein
MTPHKPDILYTMQTNKIAMWVVLGLATTVLAIGSVFYFEVRNPRAQQRVVTPSAITEQRPPTSQTDSIVPLRHVDETRYAIKDGNLVSYSGGNTIFYTFPKNLLMQLNLGALGWGGGSAVPIPNSSGKYYLSINNLSKYGKCEFSNKIFILDTRKNELTPFYEESDKTLKKDDFRACNKQMALIGTEGSSLIISYHTLETGGVCDSTWSNPEVIWYLNALAPAGGTQKYDIPVELYEKSKKEDVDCQKSL